MAKAAKKSATVAAAAINLALLQNIANATANGSVVYVNQAEGEPLLKEAYIEINTAVVDPNDATRVASRITPQGLEYIKKMATTQTVEASAPASFGIITNATLPVSKRGAKGGGAPKKYPFDQLEIGQSFFVPKSADLPDPVKTLGSTVSAANMRYATETGETKQVERTKRGPGNKAVIGPDGAKVKEMATVPVYKFSRKFTLRSVTKGQVCGAWTAPDDGALIARIAVE